MEKKVSNYFCIFCDFTCDEYGNAFNHYERHMFTKHNCEICDANKLLVYVAHHSDLSEQCDHSNESDLTPQTFKNKIEIIHTWINRFLSYQKRILNTTIGKLLLKNKVCKECAVCHYLVDNYKNSGGDMSAIQYINNNSVEHCYAHLRYNPNAMATQFITNQSNTCYCQQSVLIIRKLVDFVEYSCDTFFTEELCDEESDSNSVITITDSLSSTLYDSCSQLLISSDGNKASRNDDKLNQCLAPIHAKLNLIENSIETIIDRRLEKNMREFEKTIKSEFNKQLAIKDKEIMKLYIKITEFESNNNSIQNIRDIVESNNNSIQSIRDIVESNNSSIHNHIDTINRDISMSAPSGTISYFGSETAPNGWLKANGQSVSRTEYAKLFSTIGTIFGCGDGSITFNLPDLRGEFIRSWSDGRDGVDKDRKYGSFQWGSSVPLAGHIDGQSTRSIADAFQYYWTFSGQSFDDGFEHSVPSGQTRNGITFPNDNDIGHDGNYVQYANTTNGGYITSWNVMKGTRPRNIALLACIKY